MDRTMTVPSSSSSSSNNSNSEMASARPSHERMVLSTRIGGRPDAAERQRNDDRCDGTADQEDVDLIPDPSVLADLEQHARAISSNVDMALRDLRGTLRGMSDLTVESVQVFASSIGSTCDSVDASIKSTYTMLAKVEELNASMRGVQKMAQQVKDMRRLVEMFENHFVNDGSMAETSGGEVLPVATNPASAATG